jgi:hypothetical protein
MNQRSGKPWWKLPSGLALIGFLAIAGFFLLTEHRAHLLGVLPFLLLLACPLMHLMHGGHGGHGGSRGRDAPEGDPRNERHLH